MGEVPDLQLMLTAFTEKVKDVAHAAVVSSDGLPLACSRGFPPDLADSWPRSLPGCAAWCKARRGFSREDRSSRPSWSWTAVS